MPSLASQWAAAKAAMNNSQSNDSPGTRFGLMFDPTSYALDAVGLGDKYRNFINRTGDQANLQLSKLLGTENSNGWVGNKPASTIGLLAAGYFGGGAALNGLGGSSGGTGSGLGIFSNGGSAGLSGLGGGNAGALASQGGIAGGAGLGQAGAAAGPGALSFGKGSWQSLAKNGIPQLPGQQQQQQQQQPQRRPYLYHGQVIWM